MKSASNRQLTLLRKLGRKKYRQKEQLYLLEGSRAVKQRIENDPASVKGLFFDEEQKLWELPDWQHILEQSKTATIPAPAFAEVTDTENPQGVLALCHMPAETSIQKMIAGHKLIIALDAIQDPGNVGTILRTAVWFGVDGLISGKGTVDLFHPKVVRSTAGATGAIPFANGDLPQVLREFEQGGWPVYLLDAGEDSIALSDVQPVEKAVVVIGNEAHGLSQELLVESRTKVRISSPDPAPAVESLNAAVATSIALYQFSQVIGSQK